MKLKTRSGCNVPGVLILCAACLLINLGGVRLALWLNLPLFLDCIGTVLAAVIGGYIPGMAVGFLTNAINGLADPTTAYYGVLNVSIALAAALCAQRGWFRKPARLPLIALILALIGGGLGSVLTWQLYGGGIGEGISAPLAHRLYDNGVLSMFLSQLAADMLIDLMDKLVCVAIVMLVINLIPKETQDILYFRLWRQTFRVGYLMHLRQSQLNDLKRHTCSHAFIIGWVRHLTYHHPQE